MYFRIFIDFTRNNLKFLPPDRRAKEARVEVTKFLMSPGTPALVLSTDLKIDPLITDGMIARFLELEPPMNTVISEFQDIINEIERAYVLGMFFSATSAAAVSIERMLNFARMELHLHHPKKIKDLWQRTSQRVVRQYRRLDILGLHRRRLRRRTGGRLQGNPVPLSSLGRD